MYMYITLMYVHVQLVHVHCCYLLQLTSYCLCSDDVTVYLLRHSEQQRAPAATAAGDGRATLHDPTIATGNLYISTIRRPELHLHISGCEAQHSPTTADTAEKYGSVSTLCFAISRFPIAEICLIVDEETCCAEVRA